MIEKGSTIKVLDHGFVRYCDHLGSDAAIVEAARVSYGSISKGKEADDKLLHYLFRNQHTSPFEMGKIVFNISMPIFVMRQYIRHRMQNVNEVSARYTEMPDVFYVPDVFRTQDTKNKQGSNVSETLNHRDAQQKVLTAYKFAYKTYENLLHMGVAKEMARIVLPVGIYTEIRCCWDMSNLLKFFKLRDDAHAQLEIQEFARAMKHFARTLFPVTLDAYDLLLTKKKRQAEAIWGAQLLKIEDWQKEQEAKTGGPLPLATDSALSLAEVIELLDAA